MLQLGHINYSNCFPPHAGIATNKVAFPFRLVKGIPTELNRLLYDGKMDVSPSSSIEYATHPGRYLIFPDFSITSKKNVMSIILQSRLPLEALNKKTVALTTASATSVVLLRILLERMHNVRPNYIQYEQGVDNTSKSSDAFLTIGDLAITQQAEPGFLYRYDLGELWNQFTGLPFVFAVWHVNYNKKIASELSELYDILRASRTYGLTHLQELARTYEHHFNISSDILVQYWNSFSYHFGLDEQKGLMTFYDYAVQIGVIPRVPELRFWAA